MTSAARWALRCVAFAAAALVYGAWRQVDRELELGVVSAVARGAVVLGGLAWVWSATRPRPGKSAPSPPGPSDPARRSADSRLPAAAVGSTSAPSAGGATAWSQPRYWFAGLAGLVAVAMIVPLIAPLSPSAGETFEDCILRNVKPGLSDEGAKAVRQACRGKYPAAEQLARVAAPQVSTRTLPGTPAPAARPLSAEELMNVWLELDADMVPGLFAARIHNHNDHLTLESIEIEVSSAAAVETISYAGEHIHVPPVSSADLGKYRTTNRLLFNITTRMPGKLTPRNVGNWSRENIRYFVVAATGREN